MTLPLHPSIVHLPLGLALVAPAAFAVAAYGLWRGRPPRRAMAAAVALQAVLVVSGFVAARIGERDGQRVAQVVGEARVEAHEEQAEAFLAAASVVLIGAMATLVLPLRAGVAVAGAMALGSLIVAGLAIRAGEAGGALVYRHGAAEAFHGPTPAARAVRPASVSKDCD
jgi:uncharacterized membrane protein